MSRARLVVRQNCSGGYAPSQPFHLAIPVHNLAKAKEFYGNVLGLKKAGAAKNGKITTYLETNWSAIG